VVGEVVKMVKQIWTRKYGTQESQVHLTRNLSVESVSNLRSNNEPEIDPRSERYAPKITIEDYTAASMNGEPHLQMTDEQSKKQEPGDSKGPCSSCSDSYSANIYCQVISGHPNSIGFLLNQCVTQSQLL